MHNTTGAQTTHPSYCNQELCIRCGPNLHHRSTPIPFIPRQRDTTEASEVRVAIERVDEIDEITGRQIEHPAEMVVTYAGEHDDDRRVRWGIEDFRELANLVLDVVGRDTRVGAAS